MRVFTKTFVGHERVHLVPDWGSLVLLRMQGMRDSLPIVRIELTQQEASMLMADLPTDAMTEWVQFGTMLHIPFAIVKEETLCYAI